MKRKHISWRKKYASALLALGDIPYAHAREMTADQMISLYHVDHGILHETENENVDAWWNLTPRLISEHRIKTKADAKIIAKSRRIRAKLYPVHAAGDFGDVVTANVDRIRKIIETPAERFSRQWADYVRKTKPKQKIKSRGFDKTLRKKMSGKVVKR